MNTSRRLFSFLVISSVILILAVPAPAGSVAGIAAITIPSADVTLSFIQPGRIAKVLVKEGEEVKAGQLLIQQDDAA